jgi:tRNA(Ile)-lysidine synthase
MAALWESSAPTPGRWTLARALIAAGAATIRVERERGRQPLPELTLAAGATALWDGRFRVAAGLAPAGGVRVRALGEAGFRDLLRRGLVAAEAPARAAAAVPSFWHGDTLIAVPSLRYWAAPYASGEIGAAFVGVHFAPSQNCDKAK